ncbi:hypothetical protein FNV43_RR07484 [Rhamnella rubrinervis]|uniref:Fe2OG dioxygenase domain-containing protein n=1 Tax=Rhamnella rubrinervis TaxID=2594499 RepID=A0A8K0HFV6_9ROSA|nr:hypothetical protein FNV43_RR07484 [Rhamnella rubrinervis]
MVGILTAREFFITTMNNSSRSLRRPWSALCISREACRRFRTLGTTTSHVINVGQLCNFSSSDKDGNAELIMVDSIPTLYKNQPLRHSAMGADVNLKRLVSKFASDPSSSLSAKNDSSSLSGFTNQLDGLLLPTHFGKKRKTAHMKKPNFGQSYSTSAGANYNSYLSEDLSKVKGFDICFSGSKRSDAVQYLNAVLSTGTCSHKFEASKCVLRPGMVLLKNHLTYEEQVEIVRTCRTLGVGPGGFYQPEYKDGTKLDLQMMCLGLNWDPKRLTYEFIRSVDGCEVPSIPRPLFCQICDAMANANRLFEKEDELFEKEGEDRLPFLIANVCIVNFYSAATGRLGLHQDCSESRRSLNERLSVVSFSVGDSAEFLYGDERDECKADKVILESGDVLLFGGESRHIYHGVSSIIPNTAPKKLLEETGLRPGRLNLTFREA